MIYLDNAATTMKKPKTVIDSIVNAMSHLGNSGRGVHEGSLESSRTIYETRYKISNFFHVDSPKQIVFTANATESLNMAIKGLLEKDDHVITTMLEHNSVLRPLYEMEEKGIELTIIPANKEGNIEYQQIEEAIQPNTKAIIITHGSNLTGNVTDINLIGKIAEKYKLYLIVDASQTAGVFPIDVKEMKIDILCFTGHKSLLGPQGIGGMYVREGITLKPLKIGGSGIDTYNKKQPEQMPTALEAGTLNGHGIAGLGAAITYLEEVGINELREKELKWMWYFYEEMEQLDNVKIYGDFSYYDRCPIVSLNVGEEDSSVISDELFSTYGIATRSGGHCAPLMHQALETINQGAVRFSFSHFNIEEEIKSVVKAMKEISKSIGGY